MMKIAATTLGETGGDAVSMSMNLGYLVGTAIFAGIFIIAVAAQIKAKRFYPLTGYSLRRRRFPSVHTAHGLFGRLVLVAGFGFR